MKTLGFDVKLNLKKSPRIYVKSPDLKISYGSFSADEPLDFDGWDILNSDQKIELKHYIQNLNAVKKHLSNHILNEQTDFRFRLPLSFISAINEISSLCVTAKVELDLFEPMLAAIIQQLKIVVTKLPIDSKTKALTVLDRLGLAEYKKMDYSNQIKAIFSELIAIPKKSEKLHQKAITLFDKDKSYSPRAIEGMAKGETIPSKWLVACAIDILAEEKRELLNRILSDNDILMLWHKPLCDHGQNKLVIKLKNKYGFNFAEST